MFKIKNENGITLIALILTIIILLILAAVTIAALSGDNGILKNAAKAKEETEQAEEDEKEALENMGVIVNEHLTGIEIEQVTDENPGILEVDVNHPNTYIINSIEDLVFFAHDVTSGNTYEEKTVKLGLNLDFNSTKSYVDPLRTNYSDYGYDGELKALLTSEEGFKPIGKIYNDPDVQNYSFNGFFDGNNNTICNLYINTSNNNVEKEFRIGLFAYNYGNIQNINLYNVNISAEGNAPFVGIIAYNYGKISNINTSGNINVKATNGTTRVGGIVGVSKAPNNVIEGCNSNCNLVITIDGTGMMQIGGICGSLVGKILNCRNDGNIIITSTRTQNINVGGICGVGNGETELAIIERSKNAGEISIISNKGNCLIGGILGNGLTVTIKNCYNIGQLKSTDENISKISAGGICGTYNFAKGNKPEFSNCYSIGNLEIVINEENSIGELVGYLNYNIINCYYLNNKIHQAIGKLEKDFVIETIEIENLKSEHFVDQLNSSGEGNIWIKGKEYPILYWEK